MSWHKNSEGHRKAALKRKRQMFHASVEDNPRQAGFENKQQAAKFRKVLKEFSEGELYTGASKNRKVVKKAQALAIAYAESARM